MNNLTSEKIAIALYVLFNFAALACVDVFAFDNGATSTISQVWLSLSRKIFILSYVLCIALGILVQHLSVAKDPANGLNPAFWPQALLWTPFFWFGLYVGWRYLYQLPNVD